MMNRGVGNDQESAFFSVDIHFVECFGSRCTLFLGFRVSFPGPVSKCLSAICRRGTVNAVDQRVLRVRAVKDGDFPITRLDIGQR